MISKRWGFIICPKNKSNRGSESIILMSDCRDCKYHRGFYETGSNCVYEYASWLERQGLKCEI